MKSGKLKTQWVYQQKFQKRMDVNRPNLGQIFKKIKKIKIIYSFNHRLIWATGVSSVLSTYIVGIYSNKEFLGKSKRKICFRLIGNLFVYFFGIQVLAQHYQQLKKWQLVMHYVVCLKQMNNEHQSLLINSIKVDF